MSGAAGNLAGPADERGPGSPSPAPSGAAPKAAPPEPFPVGDRLAEVMALAALARAMLLRELRGLVVWVLGLGALCWYSVDALGRSYSTEQLRLAAGALERTPSMAAFTGPGHGMEGVADGVAPSLAALVANELLLYVALGVAALAVVLVIRHTRATEETGQAGLVRAGALRPGAEAWVVLLVLDICLTAVGLGIVAGLVLGGLAVPGALAMTAGSLGVGMCLGAAALLAAQVAPSARSARGLAFLALLAAFGLRAVGDVLHAMGEEGAWLSQLSPIGWAQAMRPWAGESWGWAVVLILVADAVALLALRLASRRDLEAPAIAWPSPPGLGRPGPRGPWALALRIQARAALWWVAGAVAMAALYGGLAGSLEGALGTISQESEYFTAFLGGSFAPRSYVSVFFAFVALLAAGAGMTVVASAWRDELAGRAEAILAAPRPRAQRVCTVAAAAAAGSLATIVAGAACLGVTSAATTGQWELARDALISALGAWPACLALIGAGALVTGVGRAVGAAVWGLFAWTAMLTLVSDLLGLPQWLRNLSVLEHVPPVLALGPGSPALDWTGALVLTGLAAALLAGGAWLVGRRDLV
ncbi:MAG: hypothetical protein Q4C85_02980 [Actinomyces sp.]|uniref:hypothetical protein n=1 Tax=Actinomyces sp. TaxID=29317 RepID=UPI0026DBB378|nr:hypothetical protein [Actinomyces sp.]MDO4242718.1 hypothetical protein [Actinomyces sp.]